MEAEPPLKEGRESARVVVVDDYDFARAAFRNILSDEHDIELVGEAANGREAIAVCAQLRPDLVLMDVRMPEMDGLAATRAIKQRHPNTSVLMVTMHENPDYLYEALKAGAAGYVLKGASQDELIGAIRRVLAGESALDQELAARLLRRLVGEVNERGNLMREAVERRGELAEPLTPRELEVLELIVRGQTNRQIAETLVLSPRTVKVHVQHIIAKLPVSDRTQAAAFAVEMGLFSHAPEE